MILKTQEFPHDGIKEIIVVDNRLGNKFTTRAHHEVGFRKMCNYLIHNGVIAGNIFDAGCWIGDNAIPWAMSCPQSTVYAVDPSIKNLAFVKNIAILNEVKNIECINSALSNCEETLYTSESLSHCSFTHNKNPKHQVLSTSIDILLDRGILKDLCFIHLDVEGFENKALEGAKKLLASSSPIIAYEQHLKTDDCQGIANYLRELGYVTYMANEVLPGNRKDSRNFWAFKSTPDNLKLVKKLNDYMGENYLSPI